MKLPKGSITRYDENGETEIIRSALNIGLISLKLNSKVRKLIEFVRVAQKGERTFQIQKKKFFDRYGTNDNESKKYEYHIYLKAVEYTIYELNRIVEIYHHEFLAHIDNEVQIDLLNSPKFDDFKKGFKKNGIYISKIDGYQSIIQLRNICNDLKHSYIQEYSLSKTLNLKSSRKFDRKTLVDKVNIYLEEIPNYIIKLAKEINIKYPKIEKNVS